MQNEQNNALSGRVLAALVGVAIIAPYKLAPLLEIGLWSIIAIASLPLCIFIVYLAIKSIELLVVLLIISSAGMAVAFVIWAAVTMASLLLVSGIAKLVTDSPAPEHVEQMVPFISVGVTAVIMLWLITMPLMKKRKHSKLRDLSDGVSE